MTRRSWSRLTNVAAAPRAAGRRLQAHTGGAAEDDAQIERQISALRTILAQPIPLRQLSKPRSSASARSSTYTTTSTVRVVATAGEFSDGAVGSSTTISESDELMALLAGRGVAARRLLPAQGRRLRRMQREFPYGATKPASIIRPLFNVSSSSRKVSMSLPVRKTGLSACFSM